MVSGGMALQPRVGRRDGVTRSLAEGKRNRISRHVLGTRADPWESGRGEFNPRIRERIRTLYEGAIAGQPLLAREGHGLSSTVSESLTANAAPPSGNTEP